MLKTLISSASLVILMATSTFADTGAERFAKEIAKYKQTDSFENCIRPRNIKRTKILDDNHIIFEMRNKKFFLNTLERKCPRLGFERAIAYNVRGGRLCNVDIVSVLDPVGTGATCFLGKFETLEKLPVQSNLR